MLSNLKASHYTQSAPLFTRVNRHLLVFSIHAETLEECDNFLEFAKVVQCHYRSRKVWLPKYVNRDEGSRNNTTLRVEK